MGERQHGSEGSVPELTPESLLGAQWVWMGAGGLPASWKGRWSKSRSVCQRQWCQTCKMKNGWPRWI